LIRGLLLAVRPQQWVKNLIVFAALIFARRMGDLGALQRVVEVFVVFCLVSGGNYLLNDLLDLERDRQHPKKRHRPIASGLVPVRVAAAFSILLEGAAVVVAFAMDPRGELGALVLGYLVLMAAYSLKLKHVVVLDVFVIASGFVVRVVAGATVIGEPVSEWLILCTIFLSLFLGFGKRRAEIILLADDSSRHREALAGYTRTFLDQMIGVSTASVITCYALYTLSPITVSYHGTKNLVFTVPFVIFGIFRYLYLLHVRDGGGSPTRALLRDVPTLVNVILWLLTSMAVINGWLDALVACVFGRGG
jgi:4-hydroxybenzoate polyprenyltransferase